MDNLPVPHKVLLALKKANLHTLESILEYSQSDLERRTNLNPSQVKGLVKIVSEAFLDDTYSFTSCLKTYERDSQVENWGRLSTGCHVLDCMLQGGILPETLTEIAGTSGAGKTQFCLQLSLMVQLPREQGGLHGQAVYISTEGALPSGRLKQLSFAVASKYVTNSSKGVTAKQLMDNVLVYHCADVHSLIAILRHKLPTLLSQDSDIKLILIDSLAALFRSEYTSSETAARLDDLKTIVSLLHHLIYSCRVTIVCTNQMTTDLTKNVVKPALGLVWSDSVNVRFILLKDETVDNGEEFMGGVKVTPRTFRVEFAPHLPMTELQYYIDNDGIHGLD